MRAWAVFAVAIAAMWSAAPVSARNVDLVLAQTKAAAGGAALDDVRAIRLTFRLRQSGLEGTGTTLTDLRTGRTITRYRLPPLSGAEGFDGRRAWFQDQAGIVTVPEGGDRPAQTVSARYRQSLAYWYPERAPRARTDFRMQLFRQRIKEALEITPQGGLKFELWFDAQTKMLERVIEEGAAETRTTIFDDFRRVGALVMPFRIRTSNAAAAFGAERIVTKVEVNPAVEETAFAMPPQPRPDFAFDRGVRETTLPFRLVDNHIYADVRLNGRMFALLIDSGAVNLITPTAARALRLSSVGDAQVKGAGAFTEHASFARVREVGIGAVRLRNQVFAVVGLERLGEVEGQPFHGIIGYELFKRFVVRIDYAKRLLTLSEPSQWRAEGAGVEIPFVFNGTVAEVSGSIGGLAATFDVDTGARTSVGLNSPFVQRHALRARFVPSIEAVTGWGLGGATRGIVARVRALKIGTLSVPDVIVDMSLPRQGVLSHAAPSGSLGSGLLKRFVVTFDYARQRIFLRARSDVMQRDAYDRAGMWLNRAKAGFRVEGVVAGSPAAAAGLSPGDHIVAVDGRLWANVELHALREMFRELPAGTVVRLTVVRGEVRRDTVLTLRNLI